MLQQVMTNPGEIIFREVPVPEVKENQVLINEYYAVANPFVSLVENINSFKTIMNEWHNNFRHYDSVTSYDQKPLFIQLIHTHNLMNSQLKTKALLKINFSEYGIPAAHTPEILKYKTLFHNLKRIPQIFKKLILSKG